LDIDDSVLLPAPVSTVSDNTDEDLDSEDEDYVEDISVEDIPSLYRDWMDEMGREDLQMLAMMEK